MIEDGFYIGIVTNRFSSNPADRILVSPLMELDEKRNIWIDISETRSRQIFPDKGLIVTFANDDSLLGNQVIKFRVRQNSKYIPGNSIRHAKFSIDRNNFSVLFELLMLNFKGSELELKEAILSGKITYNSSHNSECLIALDRDKWLGNFKFQLNNGSHHLTPTNPESLHNLKLYKIEEKNKIKSIYLNNRIFIDSDHNLGELIDIESWQPKATFIKRLINRLHEHLERLKFNSNSSIDLHEFGNLMRQKKIDKAILQRLQEHENMNNLKQEDISSIIELLTVMEPFHSKLEEAKELHLKKCREEIRTQAQQEKSGIEDQIEKLKRHYEDLQHKIDDQHTQLDQFLIKSNEELEYKIIEKNHLENQISSLKNQADQLEESIGLQQDRINQVLIEFEHSLSKRFNQLASEPTGILAEALANDAFLHFLLGKRERSLDLGSLTKPQINKPNFEIKQGTCFETIEEMITSYSSRLEKADLNTMLAIWSMTITLSGLTPVFKGNAVHRALNAFINHLAYGRCFELTLSPEIISIERLFSIGQSGNISYPGILDSAILCAATHRESLFILVLDGLDRAPSQYFLDTLLNW